VSAGVDRTSDRVTLVMLWWEGDDDSGVGARRTVSVKTGRAQDGRRWMVATMDGSCKGRRMC
jgi:hypothetical protein